MCVDGERIFRQCERKKEKKERGSTNQPKKGATGQIIRHFCFLILWSYVTTKIGARFSGFKFYVFKKIVLNQYKNVL